MLHVVVARHLAAFFTSRFPWRQGRLLLALLLTVGLVMGKGVGPVHASGSQVADCTFAKL